VAAKDWAGGRTASVFDAADARRVGTARTAATTVRSLALDHAGGRVAVAGGPDVTRGDPGTFGELFVCDVATGRVLRRPDVPSSHVVTLVALSPDGRRVAGAVRELAPGNGPPMPAATTTVRIWDVDAGGEPVVVDGRANGPATCLAFSPDGRRVAFADTDGRVLVHDAVTGREACPPLSASAPPTGLAFSPDGRRLAGVGMDGLVRLWDVAGGHELLTLRGLGPPGSGHYGFTARVAFSPDGTRLAANDWDGTITIWDAGPAGGRDWLDGGGRVGEGR
jgi:WD40 repeat protein